MDLESAYALDGCETAMAEIAGVSRYAFSVTLLDPISQNLISIFITVGPGGTITAVPHTSLLGTHHRMRVICRALALTPLPSLRRCAALLRRIRNGTAYEVAIHTAHAQAPPSWQTWARQQPAHNPSVLMLGMVRIFNSYFLNRTLQEGETSWASVETHVVINPGCSHVSG